MHSAHAQPLRTCIRGLELDDVLIPGYANSSCHASPLADDNHGRIRNAHGTQTTRVVRAAPLSDRRGVVEGGGHGRGHGCHHGVVVRTMLYGRG